MLDGKVKNSIGTFIVRIYMVKKISIDNIPSWTVYGALHVQL
jgi:hypothetical protein